MIPVIMSGGSGTRLWPISRTKLPKQFNNLVGESLQALTMKRVSKLGTPWIVTGTPLRDLTEKKKRELDLNDITCIYEPMAKNTAPAIALLVHLLSSKGLNSEIVGVFPADQLIENEKVFIQVIGVAERLALQNKIVTLGIKPTYPSTGFGYIQAIQETVGATSEIAGYPVLKFHEKPNAETAKTFIESGHFYWNAGIFIFQVQQMKLLFEKYQPKMWMQISQVKGDLSNLKDIYSSIENISIDYAIMEKLSPEELSCVPSEMGWNDIGSWDAVAELKAETKAELKNDNIGEATNLANLTNTANVVLHKASGNYVMPIENKVYAIAGVDDIIVVDTPDALLISKKGSSQDVKFLVNQLRQTNPKVLDEHLFEERPWGNYEILRDTEYFKSKIIKVEVGGQLSYQSHNKREEHWIIVRGEGILCLNGDDINVKTGSNITIPCGAKHRIKNTGTQLLEFIEVQLGSYFGEDDIVRYQDNYSRT